MFRVKVETSTRFSARFKLVQKNLLPFMQQLVGKLLLHMKECQRMSKGNTRTAKGIVPSKRPEREGA